MQRLVHDESTNNGSTSNGLEHYDGADDAPTGPQRDAERDLNPYEEDEVATAPWPPQPSYSTN